MNKYILILSVMLSSNSFAGWYQGKVTHVFPVNHEGGRVYVFLDDGGGEASCGSGKAFYIDPNTEMGKVLLSVPLVAKTTEKLVWVNGNGKCVGGWPSQGSEAMLSMDLKG